MRAIILTIAFFLLLQNDDRLILNNVTVIDGNGGKPQDGVTLLIAGDRVADIYPAGSRKLPEGVPVLELAGHYVIPGLIDSHYHLNAGTRAKKEEESLRRFALLGGITAVRDMAGDGAALAELAKAANDRDTASPRVYFSALIAGKSWFKDERVSILMHGLPAGEAPWARAIEQNTNLVKVITDAKASGATGIKLYADLSPELVVQISREAHRQGLKVWSHATIFPSRPSDVVKAGADVVSHSHMLVWELVNPIPKISDQATNRQIGWTSVKFETPKMKELLQEMRKRGTMLDDTVIWMKHRLVPAIEKAEAEKTEQERTSGLAGAIESWTFGITKLAHSYGIPIVAGTDFQEHPESQDFPNLHTELELLVTRCGLTPVQAITTATHNAALMLGIQQSHGTISKGKIADLIVLSANPAEDIRNTTKIMYVLKGGKVYEAQGEVVEK